MTVSQLSDLYGKSMKTVRLQNGEVVQVYGILPELGMVTDSVASQPVTVVFDPQGRASAIYSRDHGHEVGKPELAPRTKGNAEG